MKAFLTENFLLQTKTAEKLYFDFACNMPIFDYHCHLPVEEIASDKKFENLTRIWLKGDHYKWRAMRTCGVDEELITGSADDYSKFKAWAETVPKTIRNPLFHWTHLELKNPFGITGKILNSDSCDEIYRTCNELLQTEAFSVKGILRKMKVKVICTTDDPLDDLGFHRQIAIDTSFPVKVLPAFRPDASMKVENPSLFNDWLKRLEALMQHDITNVTDLLDALKQRIDFFHDNGCRLSDHAVDKMDFAESTLSQADAVFAKTRSGHLATVSEIALFKSFMLLELARMYAEKNWTQQFHIGTIRNVSSRMFKQLGPDTGFDSMGDLNYAESLAKFLDHLDKDQKLARTILYTINPKDNEMLATMIGNFQDGKTPGKMQLGSGWWFNDQKDGMEKQMNVLSTMGLLSQFVGMLTDSRSFLSYPRHEYFRRILCNLFGKDIENGELPADFDLIGSTIQDICYHNAERYFKMI